MAGFGDPHLTTVDASGLRLGIVGSRWHSDLVDHMVDRAQQAAKACGVDDVVVTRVAGSVGLDLNKLRADMVAPETEAVLKRNLELAQAIEVRGTPAFVIGDTLVPGAVDLPTLRRMVGDAKR